MPMRCDAKLRVHTGVTLQCENEVHNTNVKHSAIWKIAGSPKTMMHRVDWTDSHNGCFRGEFKPCGKPKCFLPVHTGRHAC
jgi:hypothetical protein